MALWEPTCSDGAWPLEGLHLFIVMRFLMEHGRLRACVFWWSMATWGPAFTDEARPLEGLRLLMKWGYLGACICYETRPIKGPCLKKQRRMAWACILDEGSHLDLRFVLGASPFSLGLCLKLRDVLKVTFGIPRFLPSYFLNKSHSIIFISCKHFHEHFHSKLLINYISLVWFGCMNFA